MKKLLYISLAVVLAPLILVAGVVVVGGAAISTSQAANATASAACTYANPDPVRIAVAMEQLTHEPVDAQHWDTYSAAAGIDPAISFQSSTIEQRHLVLVHAVQSILASTPPNSVTTPPIVWWHGQIPADNDVTWENELVPGWAGTLGDYIDAFVDIYATDPVVLAAGTDGGSGCLPPTSSVCSPPTETAAILATIRALESGNNYTESRHSRASGYARASGNPTGAYQYIYNSWGHYRGYDEAYQAPPAVQDERANNDVTAVLERFGSVEWVPIAWYVGSGGAAKVRSGEWPLSYIPNPKYNRISIGDYQAKWMRHYTTVELPRAGAQLGDCPEGAAAVIAWASSRSALRMQRSTPTASAHRPGPATPSSVVVATATPSRQGTIVYDCSDFVIEARWQA